MRRYLVCLVAGVFLSTPIHAQISARYPAPAGFLDGPPHTVGDYSKIRTVAVLSGIGPTVTVQKQRTIGIKRTEFAIADWQIDPFVVSRVREYLADRFLFKDVVYDVRAMGRLPATVLRDTNRTVRGFFNTVPKDVDPNRRTPSFDLAAGGDITQRAGTSLLRSRHRRESETRERRCAADHRRQLRHRRVEPSETRRDRQRSRPDLLS
jgi:hypothetical protein